MKYLLQTSILKSALKLNIGLNSNKIRVNAK